MQPGLQARVTPQTWPPVPTGGLFLSGPGWIFLS